MLQRMCSKQATGCFLVYQTTSLIWKKNVYSNKVKTCYFSNTKNVCSKQAGIIQKMLAQNKRGTTFQFIKLLFVIQKMRVQKKAGGCFCSTKNVCSKQVRGCFLVY